MGARAWLAVSLLVVVAAAGALLPGRVQAADPSEDGTMTVFVVEGMALRESPGGGAMATSLMALFAAMEPDRPIAFIDAERSSTVLGPVAPSSPAFSDMAYRIGAELSSGPGGGDDLLSAVAEAGTLLGLERAGPGSEVIVLLGADGGAGADSLVARLTPLVSRISDRGYSLRAAAASDVAGVADLARRISSIAGGSAIDASSPQALLGLAHELVSRSGASMDSLGDFQRGQGEIVTVPVVVAPGTMDLRLIALKDGSGGSVRLVDPSGSERGQDAATALGPEYLAAWTVDRPDHGIWKLEAGGLGGSLSVWGARANGIALNLESDGPVPVDQPVDLVASARPLPRVDGEAEVYAHVTSPDGGSVTYLLRDDGLGPDAAAGDGYFSGSTAPIPDPGEYGVVLELVWEGTAFKVNSRHSLRAQPFPTLGIEEVVEGDLAAGERTLVAVASVTVDGQPYAVSPDSIGVELSGRADADHLVEAVARELSSAGEGWVFDIYATFAGPGTSALSISLDTEYAGSLHSHSGGFIVLGVPAPPAAPAPEPAVGEPPAPVPAPQDSSFPWWVLAFPALVIAAIGAVAVRWLVTAQPAGYLYDDASRRVADFSAVDRRPLHRLLQRNLVSGRDLGVPGLDGVTFVFERGRVSVRVDRPSTTVRVEGLPLSGQAELGPESWIGAGGRAYSFLAAGRA